MRWAGPPAILALALLAVGCSTRQSSSPPGAAASLQRPASAPESAADPQATTTTAAAVVTTDVVTTETTRDGSSAGRGTQPRQASPKTAGSPRPPAPAPAFRGSAQPIDAATRSRMTSSWRPGCPVPIEDLRLLTLEHWGFDGGIHRGELVVHRDHADAVLRAMRRLFEARFPIDRMQLVDAYGGDDDRSMAANNTSAFNCRAVTGRPGVWSQHSYGWAVDVNPVQNPYVSGGRVSPPAGAGFVNRSARRPGMVENGAVQAFASVGWGWGGNWTSSKDYQHFSATGR